MKLNITDDQGILLDQVDLGTDEDLASGNANRQAFAVMLAAEAVEAEIRALKRRTQEHDQKVKP